MIALWRNQGGCRLQVGAWFATTSLLPTFAAFLLVGKDAPLWHKVLLLLVPVCVAGACGASLGISIAEPTQCVSDRHALIFGVTLMLSAYALSVMVLATGFFIPNVPGALAQRIVSSLALALLSTLLLFPVVTPKLLLLICGTGAVAGWLLHRYSTRLAVLTLLDIILSSVGIWWLLQHPPASLHFPHISVMPL